MPRVSDDSQQSTPPPKGPHLALHGVGGKKLGMPPGCVISVVLDPTKVDGVTPWQLTKVGTNRWEFRCACLRPDCDRTATAVFKFKGQHRGPGIVR